MDKELMVTYCGLYCRLCDHHARIPPRAKALCEALAMAEYRDNPELLKQLDKLASPDAEKCCRSGKCGDPACAIRKCALGKGIFTCPQCTDYPCERVIQLARSEATLLHDGQRIRNIGLAAWIEEQEERRGSGFCYADVRCLPCEIPRE